MSITQHKFIRDIIQDAGLISSKPASTLLPLGVKLSSQDTSVLPDPEPYRCMVGRLLYLSFTRLDISFGAQQLSQFVHWPCDTHMNATLHLVRYLKGCFDQCLFFPSSTSFSIIAYCDADWVGCVDSKRSLMGYCIFLGEALLEDEEANDGCSFYGGGRVQMFRLYSLKMQLADVFTKFLPGPAFTSAISKLSLASFPKLTLRGG
ncbi:UNVERIFIED_CONTAM: Retrovirus-related Pol polyprotein from transposon RE2 [Sesamum calycinum]|uniref:Retrovirus-related Pol polyprotein from transposon RE2 n=1 Tax=Sesamum calycinum TaxID=2727403 RepID=A0AAW2SFM3_9LAMI